MEQIGTKWLQINQDELIVSPWEEIRDDILKVFEKVYNYGENSIPVNSADYIMASNLALMFWNMAQGVRSVFDQHSLTLAAGRNLDKIMSYYGEFRKASKKWVLKVELNSQGDKYTKLNEYQQLYSTTNSQVVFNFLQQVEQKDQSMVYYVIAGDLYNVGAPELRKMRFQTIDGLVTNGDSENEIIVFQRDYESDESFKNRVINKTDYHRLKVELAQNEYVDKFELVDGKTIINSLDKVNPLVGTGELGVIVLVHKWVEQSREKNIYLGDIFALVSDFLPIGLITKGVTNANLYGAQVKETNTEVNDVVNHKLNITFLEPVRGGLSFIINGNYEERVLQDKLGDLLQFLNDKSLFYNYQKSDLIKLISKLFNFDWNSLKVFQTKTDKALVLKEQKWVKNSGRHTAQLEYTDLGSAQPVWSNIEEVNSTIYRSFSFEFYEFILNDDNTISVVVY